ncbi:MAG: hypothetical protein M1840_008735 [Geoglossum simile]|nr:MAG: hypothetical protein M1840_008735 [Geoglossum simile]
MEAISIAASIGGLLTVAGKISSVMQAFVSSTINASSLSRSVQHEIQDITTVLMQLQPFVLGDILPEPSRGTMIEVHQVMTALVGTVCTFSELEREMDGLVSDENMGTLDRVRWAWKESAIERLCQRLRDHKLSLSLILTVLTCKSSIEAKSSVDTLCGLVTRLIESNTEMLNRIRTLESTMQFSGEGAVDGDADAIVVTSPEQLSEKYSGSYCPGFENDLFGTRVYKRGLLRNSAVSSASFEVHSQRWSILSGLSLSDISNISVLSLPLLAGELYNPVWYDTTQCSASGRAIRESILLAEELQPPQVSQVAASREKVDFGDPRGKGKKANISNVFNGVFWRARRRSSPSSKFPINPEISQQTLRTNGSHSVPISTASSPSQQLLIEEPPFGFYPPNYEGAFEEPRCPPPIPTASNPTHETVFTLDSGDSSEKPHHAYPILATADPVQETPHASIPDSLLPNDNDDILFLAASLFEFSISKERREDGFPYLSYLPGEIFDVFGEKGELWLAKNEDDITDQLGWVWSRHFVQLAKE